MPVGIPHAKRLPRGTPLWGISVLYRCFQRRHRHLPGIATRYVANGARGLAGRLAGGSALAAPALLKPESMGSSAYDPDVLAGFHNGNLGFSHQITASIRDRVSPLLGQGAIAPVPSRSYQTTDLL